MTGTLSDGTVVDAAIVDAALGRDIGPYTDREGSIERLITRLRNASRTPGKISKIAYTVTLSYDL